jgi:hypothetical protein
VTKREGERRIEVLGAICGNSSDTEADFGRVVGIVVRAVLGVNGLH